jgi:hypothetical protein
MSSEDEKIYFEDFSIQLINKPGVFGMGKGYYFTSLEEAYFHSLYDSYILIIQ